MEFILTNNNRVDLCMLPDSASVDIDIGTDNDLQVVLQLSDQSDSSCGYIYCDGTEYGGELQNPVVNTSDSTITYTGYTFRGLLDMRPVMVPSGQNYKTVSGSLDSILSSLISDNFDSLFTYVTSASGVNVTSFKFPRYYSLLNCMERILAEYDRRLVIKADGSGENLVVKVSSVVISDLSDDVEYSQDTGFNFKIQKATRKIQHVLALGSGTLQDRLVKMYSFNGSTLTEINSFPKNVLIETYELSNSESEDDLKSETLKHMKDISVKDSQEMTVPDNLELSLGDVVAGRDYITGTYIKQSVTGIIIKQSAGTMTISYKVGD